MPCELHDEAWSALLEARRLLAGGIRDLTFVARQGEWSCAPSDEAELDGAEQVLYAGDGSIEPPPKSRVTFYRPDATGPAQLEHPTNQPVDEAMLAFARVYLPIVLGAAAARSNGTVFVAAHVTQTLDGRIACANGQSQWIGNSEDLRHAHRMRALLDGVMVGARTVLKDDPLLTVRHVEGVNPRRLVLTGGGSALQGSKNRKVFDAPGSLVIVRSDTEVAKQPDHVEIVSVQHNCRQKLAPATVLEALQGRGIHSIYLEGGAQTVSSFLATAAIDVLQVHIAAMVLGSGLSSFALPEVEHVRDGRPVVMDHVSLQGHLLLTCWPRPVNP